LSSPLDRLKEGQRWMWSLGDYARLAKVLEPHAEALADACALGAGMEVLDVAAGNGNFALAGARRGATVTATDLTPRMVELGRARSAAGQVDITWAEADAEQLPFADSSYDVVASVFGAMFAPQPKLVASEMFRVAKPGGLVAMANYSAGGYLGRLSELMASFSAHPSFELPSPFAWGDEDELRRRFAPFSLSVDVLHRTLFFESDSVDAFVDFWLATNAPQAALKAMLPPETYKEFLVQKARLVEDLNESTDGRVRLSSPYILVVAPKP
jgi:ubiquinone/menaquinone biosynthesis C-methylase UbiE